MGSIRQGSDSFEIKREQWRACQHSNHRFLNAEKFGSKCLSTQLAWQAKKMPIWVIPTIWLQVGSACT